MTAGNLSPKQAATLLVFSVITSFVLFQTVVTSLGGRAITLGVNIFILFIFIVVFIGEYTDEKTMF